MLSMSKRKILYAILCLSFVFLTLGLFAHAEAQTSVATAVTAPAAPTAPFSVDSSKINSGDTAWMLTSSALVLFMTIPGLALFYGGMVRKKNVLATLMQSFTITCVVTIVWTVVGYSLAFTHARRLVPRRLLARPHGRHELHQE